MSRVTRGGADWITPPVPMTQAQRARRDGPIFDAGDRGWFTPAVAMWIVLLAAGAVALVLS